MNSGPVRVVDEMGAPVVDSPRSVESGGGSKNWPARHPNCRSVRVALLDSRGNNVRVHYLQPGEQGWDGDLPGLYFAGYRLDWEPEEGWGAFKQGPQEDWIPNS